MSVPPPSCVPNSTSTGSSSRSVRSTTEVSKTTSLVSHRPDRGHDGGEDRRVDHGGGHRARLVDRDDHVAQAGDLRPWPSSVSGMTVRIRAGSGAGCARMVRASRSRSAADGGCSAGPVERAGDRLAQRARPAAARRPPPPCERSPAPSRGSRPASPGRARSARRPARGPARPSPAAPAPAACGGGSAARWRRAASPTPRTTGSTCGCRRASARPRATSRPGRPGARRRTGARGRGRA